MHLTLSLMTLSWVQPLILLAVYPWLLPFRQTHSSLSETQIVVRQEENFCQEQTSLFQTPPPKETWQRNEKSSKAQMDSSVCYFGAQDITVWIDLYILLVPCRQLGKWVQLPKLLWRENGNVRKRCREHVSEWVIQETGHLHDRDKIYSSTWPPKTEGGGFLLSDQNGLGWKGRFSCRGSRKTGIYGNLERKWTDDAQGWEGEQKKNRDDARGNERGPSKECCPSKNTE